MLDTVQMYRLDGVGGGNLGKCQAASLDVQPDRLPKPGRPSITDREVGGVIARCDTGIEDGPTRFGGANRSVARVLLRRCPR